MTALVPSLIVEIARHYDLAVQASASAVSHWVEVGRCLIQLKREIRATIGPRRWQHWVDHESGLPFGHHQASKAMAVARRYDLLTRKLPPGELLRISSLNQLLAMTVSGQERQQKLPKRQHGDRISDPTHGIDVADLASLVIHIWQDWAGHTRGYQPSADKLEAFSEALPDVVAMLTEIAATLDIDLAPAEPPGVTMEGEAVDLGARRPDATDLQQMALRGPGQPVEDLSLAGTWNT